MTSLSSVCESRWNCTAVIIELFPACVIKALRWSQSKEPHKLSASLFLAYLFIYLLLLHVVPLMFFGMQSHLQIGNCRSLKLVPRCVFLFCLACIIFISLLAAFFGKTLDSNLPVWSWLHLLKLKAWLKSHSLTHCILHYTCIIHTNSSLAVHS